MERLYRVALWAEARTCAAPGVLLMVRQQPAGGSEQYIGIEYDDFQK